MQNNNPINGSFSVNIYNNSFIDHQNYLTFFSNQLATYQPQQISFPPTNSPSTPSDLNKFDIKKLEDEKYLEDLTFGLKMFLSTLQLSAESKEEPCFAEKVAKQAYQDLQKLSKMPEKPQNSNLSSSSIEFCDSDSATSGTEESSLDEETIQLINDLSEKGFSSPSTPKLSTKKRKFSNQTKNFENPLPEGFKIEDQKLSLSRYSGDERKIQFKVLKNKPKNGKFQASWNKRFEQLKKYIAIKGTIYITRATPGYEQLGTWVFEQRRKLVRGKITKEQFEKLNEIGFIWDRSSYFYRTKKPRS